jgi:hypothetical protein
MTPPFDWAIGGDALSHPGALHRRPERAAAVKAVAKNWLICHIGGLVAGRHIGGLVAGGLAGPCEKFFAFRRINVLAFSG